jgi:hypothetical protein
MTEGVEHFKKLLKLIQTSHATKEEQRAIWGEFLTLYTGIGLENKLKEKIMAKGQDKGRKAKKKPKQKK